MPQGTPVETTEWDMCFRKGRGKHRETEGYHKFQQILRERRDEYVAARRNIVRQQQIKRQVLETFRQSSVAVHGVVARTLVWVGGKGENGQWFVAKEESVLREIGVKINKAKSSG